MAAGVGRSRRIWEGRLSSAAYAVSKVTEGGVTRNVARAMEVLHASSADTRVRVMRAVYHSSSGPGVPAASFMLHSSRRVIPSGSKILDSPTLTKPLEISSAPYESSPEPETTNYHVTEPDDSEISQPSKWRGSNSSKSIRMPSEESSSTDNASIIDVSLKAHHSSSFTKCSLDSDNSDIITTKKHSSRASPILESANLSTLQYKSLLNGNNDWINRRKSYSFEDTAPLSETIVHSNDTLAMESSTDSGICKSTEIVNEPNETNISKQMIPNGFSTNEPEEHTFKDWLNRNRSSSGYSLKQNITQTLNDQVTVRNDRQENNIAVQSTSRVSIALSKKDEDYNNKRYHISDDRKTKRVEFCKTELHFAAETGRVNIIATDEKPPPSSDFRKRRSAFVPIREKFEKPITLFGEKINDFSEFSNIGTQSKPSPEPHDIEDHSAATKSILKNKIPKPKPYLLGENMEFGVSDDQQNPERENKEVPSTISLINSQLHGETTSLSHRKFKSISRSDRELTSSRINYSPSGVPIDDGQKPKTFNIQIQLQEQTTANEKEINPWPVRRKLNTLQMSPIQERTRKLKDSDLTYFGINNEKAKETTPKYFKERLALQNDSIDDIFQSVRLVQRVSSSVGNSEAESEDDPEYQNVPFKHTFAPVPTPRGRKPEVLKSINEQENHTETTREKRKSRSRTHEEISSATNRSISEPPKANRRRIKEDNKSIKQTKQNHFVEVDRKSPEKRTPQNIDGTATYINLGGKNENHRNHSYDRKKMDLKVISNVMSNESSNSQKRNQTHYKHINNNAHDFTENRKHRTKVLSTPDDPSDRWKASLNKSSQKSSSCYEAKEVDNQNNNQTSDKYKRKSSQQNRTSTKPEEHYFDQKGTNKSHNSKNSIEKSKVTNSIGYQHISQNKFPLDDKSTHRQSSRKLPNMVKMVDVNEKQRDTPKQITKEVNHKNGHDHSNVIVHKSKPSEYVINYDDKNGTVSSICKIRSGTNGSNRKNVKDIVKESKNKKSQKVRNAAP